MSEFLPRTGPVAPVVSATERGPAVRAAAPARSMRSGIETGTRSAPGLTERTTAAADYAKIKASIADVLAGMQPARQSGGDSSAESAERAIMALMPDPVIVLPLPPADPNMVAFVAQVGQSIARQTAQTRAAQATATPLMVEAAAN